MSQMSLGDVLMLSVAAAVVMFVGGCNQAPNNASNPDVTFEKPVVQCKGGGADNSYIQRCYDKELHVYCYKISKGISCVPGQWTYDEKDEPYEG